MIISFNTLGTDEVSTSCLILWLLHEACAS